MRIRTIKPDFWTDDLVGSFTRETRLLFIASWNIADDEGLLRWSAPFLKGAVFPFDDDISIHDVEGMMAALEKTGVIFPYTGGRSAQRLAFVVNFSKHQRINRPSPSKLPPPSLQSRDVRMMYAARDEWRCHLCGGTISQDEKEFGNDFIMSVDHVVPESSGGSDYPSNIRSSHLTCNKGRGSMSVDDYRSKVASGETESLKRWTGRHPAHVDGICSGKRESHSLSDSMNGSTPDREVEVEVEKDIERQPSASASEFSLSTEPPPKRTKPEPKPRERDPLFDTLGAVSGADPRELTKRAASACGVALAEIRKATPDVTPEEIARRARNYRTHFRSVALTPSALANHWATCANESNVKQHGSNQPNSRSFSQRNDYSELDL